MKQTVSRRHFLKTSSGLFVFPMVGHAKASSSPPPQAYQGLALGDVSTQGVVLWSRCNQAATFSTEWSEYEDFRYTHRCPDVDAQGSSDFTTKLGLSNLPPDRDIYVRSVFRSVSTGKKSEQLRAQFRTPSETSDRALKFAWSGDLCGQGYGINPDIGGYRIFSEIQKTSPDVFFNCGDVIYADGPLRLEKKLRNNKIWSNVVTPEKEQVAQTLNQFRGNHRYNYLDPNFREFSASCPQVYIWDDHETKNNWWLKRTLKDRRYSERKCRQLSAWARQSFFEYLPIAQQPSAPKRLYRKLSQGPLADVFVLDTRSFRGPNSPGKQRRMSRDTAVLGSEQLTWLIDELSKSKALWKLIICPQPLGLNVHDGEDRFDGFANNHSGKPRGRELELAHLLSELKKAKVSNTVWLTADVHYAAAHHFQPERAKFKNFEPFWEFLAGPLNAATFGPNGMDPTFGPEVVYQSLPKGLKPGASPLEPYQFFGTGEIDPLTHQLTIRFFNQFGQELWHRSVEAQHG